MEGNSNTEEQSQEKKKRKKWLLLLLLLLLIFFAGYTGYKLYQDYLERKSQVQSGILGEIGNGIMPGMTQEELQKYLNEKADKSKFTINLNSKLEFDDSNSKGYLRLINGRNSAYAIKFTIKLDGSNEVIYKSSLVRPEQYIEYIKLSKKLDKGKYSATGIYEFYNPEQTNVRVAEQQVALDINIKN